jgi:hypothetical protein
MVLEVVDSEGEGNRCLGSQGEFIELVPWRSEVQWAIEPWGSWKVWGRSEKFEALVEATTDEPGTPLRFVPLTKHISPSRAHSPSPSNTHINTYKYTPHIHIHIEPTLTQTHKHIHTLTHNHAFAHTDSLTHTHTHTHALNPLLIL